MEEEKKVPIVGFFLLSGNMKTWMMVEHWWFIFLQLCIWDLPLIFFCIVPGSEVKKWKTFCIRLFQIFVRLLLHLRKSKTIKN
jgi:hypothetical protein